MKYPMDRLERNLAIVAEMRDWYEEHREKWHRRMTKPYFLASGYSPAGDEFMQAFVTKMRSVFDEVKAEEQAHARARQGLAIQPKGKPPLRFKRPR